MKRTLVVVVVLMLLIATLAGCAPAEDVSATTQDDALTEAPKGAEDTTAADVTTAADDTTAVDEFNPADHHIEIGRAHV